MKYILIFLFLVSCQSTPRGPEQALNDFIEARYEKRLNRDFILENTGGDFRKEFENAKEEAIETFGLSPITTKPKLEVLRKVCQVKKCTLTYVISYKTLEEKKAKFTSEIKKIAIVEEVEGKWIIMDVSNVRTYHESSEPINAY